MIARWPFRSRHVPNVTGGDWRVEAGRRRSIYIAGPMSGHKDYNFPAFHTAAARLRHRGYQVINPAETDHGDTTKPWAYYMRRDIGHLLTVDAVAVLPGWQASRGATLEVTIARALDLPILDIDTLEPVRETVLDEAARLIHGARQQAYGHPADDFGRTAALWRALFGWDATAADVPAAMRMVKESRLRASPRHRDSLVDICGYAGTQELVWERLEE